MSFHVLAVLVKKMIRETAYSPILWRWGFELRWGWLVVCFVVGSFVFVVLCCGFLFVCYLFLNFSFIFNKVQFGVIFNEVLASKKPKLPYHHKGRGKEKP